MDIKSSSAIDAEQVASFDYLNRCAEKGAWHHAWLNRAVSELNCLSSGILTVDDNCDGRLMPVAAWPAEIKDLALLSDLVDEAVHCGVPVIIPQKGSGAQDNTFGIAFPVKSEGQIVAVFACHAVLPTSDLISLFMTKTEWLCQWIELEFSRQVSRKKSRAIMRQKIALDGYVAINQCEEWKQAAHQWLDGLLTTFDCERVSIGFVVSGTVKLAVISGSTEQRLISILAKKITVAMQECYDQNALIVWPIQDNSSFVITHNTKKLSESIHNVRLLQIPLLDHEQVYAVIMLERPADSEFLAHEIDLIESVVSLVGLSLKSKREAGLSVFRHSVRAAKKQLERFLSPGFLKRKLFVIVVAFLATFFATVTGDFSVNANAELEPTDIRIVSAPFAGYIKQANKRAGDVVSVGDVIVALEDRDLRLEKLKWLSQINQIEKQYTEVIASGQRAQAQIYSAQMDQAKAQLDITTSQLERAVIKAPIESLVVSGDLSKRVGGSVTLGEELFQISPVQSYRLIIYVSEYRIRDVRVGQHGRVLFSSLTNQEFKFTVAKILPVAVARDGGAFFKVEATLDSVDPILRPGLVGVGKVYVDERLLIDIWTYSLRKWLALEIWSFWG